MAIWLRWEHAASSRCQWWDIIIRTASNAALLPGRWDTQAATSRAACRRRLWSSHAVKHLKRLGYVLALLTAVLEHTASGMKEPNWKDTIQTCNTVTLLNAYHKVRVVLGHGSTSVLKLGLWTGQRVAFNTQTSISWSFQRQFHFLQSPSY